jgi:hypothetical protein
MSLPQAPLRTGGSIVTCPVVPRSCLLPQRRPCFAWEFVALVCTGGQRHVESHTNMTLRLRQVTQGCKLWYMRAWISCCAPQVRKVGDFTSKLVAGMREDLDVLSERVEHRDDGEGDTEALLAVSVWPVAGANVGGPHTSQGSSVTLCS